MSNRKNQSFPKRKEISQNRKVLHTPSRQRDDSGPLRHDALRRLYSIMLKCRLVEGHIARVVQRQHLPKDYVPAIGREATEVGATLDLGPDDFIAPAKRSLAAHIVRGVPLKDIFSWLLLDPGTAKRRTVPSRGARAGGLESDVRNEEISKAPKILAPPRPVAAQFAMAAGIAFTSRMLGKAAAVVALAPYSGDSSFKSVLEYANANRLPILFILETQARVAGRADASLLKMAEALQMPGLVVDGNDGVAVYRVAHESIQRARQGYGPALLECRRYRGYSSHHGNGQPRSSDPLLLIENYLEAQGLWAEEWKRQLVEEYGREIREALRKIGASS